MVKAWGGAGENDTSIAKAVLVSHPPLWLYCGWVCGWKERAFVTPCNDDTCLLCMDRISMEMIDSESIRAGLR
jgi:hypothetical protein